MDNLDRKEIIVLEEGEEERIDIYLSLQIDSFSRSKIQQLIRSGHIIVNHNQIKPNYLIKPGDIIHIETPEPAFTKALPEDIPIEILYEDSHVIVVNKPKSMVVHPAPGNYTQTLVNALLFHCAGRLSSINGIIRPGIVHRIDKDTSGILVIAKTDEAHTQLAEQFYYHSIHRIYELLAFGVPKNDTYTVNQPLARSIKDRKKMAVMPGGKEAITHFSVLERFHGYSHLEAQLETGRTHQIRVHSAHLGFPIVGDTVYTSRNTPFHAEGQCLHAKTLGFKHPITQKYMEFSCSPPEIFANTLRIIRQRFPENN